VDKLDGGYLSTGGKNHGKKEKKTKKRPPKSPKPGFPGVPSWEILKGGEKGKTAEKK